MIRTYSFFRSELVGSLKVGLSEILLALIQRNDSLTLSYLYSPLSHPCLPGRAMALTIWVVLAK